MPISSSLAESVDTDGWRYISVDVDGWRYISVDTDGWHYISVDTDGWHYISVDTVFSYSGRQRCEEKYGVSHRKWHPKGARFAVKSRWAYRTWKKYS